MTSITDQPVERVDLARFGYPQELHRRVGSFASFAAGFSFVSILTTVFQLFFLGYGFGGAAFFWTWPIVFFGQLLVALNFSTLAARFPISGAIFQWSSRLAGQTFGWFTGWVMIIGQTLTVAAAAIALQAVLPSIWPGFQFLGGGPSPPPVTGAHSPALSAAPSLTAGTRGTVGLPFVVEAVFGGTAGRIILADVVIAIIVCTLA